MTDPHIITAQSSDVEWVADLIGDSFQPLAVTAWLLPDPAERAKILPRQFELYVEYALEHGLVHATSDRSAAAVWMPQGFAELPPPRDYDRRLAEICGTATERFAQLDALFEANHPHHAPHHHLALLGVNPARQSDGLGTMLLHHHHATLDRENIAGFLEASSTGSRELYLRHGYEPLGEPYAAPNGATFWPMWRPPQQS